MRPLLVTCCLLLVLAAGCGEDEGAAPPQGTAAGAWGETLAAARGTRVRWWTFGGDARVNAYIDRQVIPAAEALGVRLERVPVADTADAVRRVVAQRRAGKESGGAVDLIWINGENFAAGKDAGLWLEDWAGDLPNARFLDPRDPSLLRDFQVPVDGQESPWSRAAFVLAHDAERVPDPPRDLPGLLAWAREHPGRFTYPAPPDFTGSAFVRQVVQRLGEDEAFAYLRELQPLLFEGGDVQPRSEAELNELFANGQVDFAMSYDASFVAGGVRRGQFPESTRPFRLEGGALTNVSFVTIPADAANPAGARVVADLLLRPDLQAAKADPRVLGQPTVLDLGRLSAGQRRAFDDAAGSPYLLEDLGTPLEELPASEVPRLERRWEREVQPR